MTNYMPQIPEYTGNSKKNSQYSERFTQKMVRLAPVYACTVAKHCEFLSQINKADI